MITRRRLLALLPAFTVSVSAKAQTAAWIFPHRRKKPVPVRKPFVYIGVDTAMGVAKGIYVSRLDPATGQLTAPILAAETLRPAFFAAGPSLAGRQVLYCTNEGDDKTSTVTSWSIDPDTGALRLIGSVSSGFAGPCYISVDATGRSAYVACYAGSGVASYLIEPNGALSGPIERLDFRKPAFGAHGPNAARQDAPHPHCTVLSPDDRFLAVCDLGNDEISLFSVDPATARLGPLHQFNNHRPGSGPRHVAFHPNGRWVYGIDELDSKIDQYLWLETHGHAPEALLTDTDNTVSTLPPDFHGVNTAAEIVIAPSGYFLYASNRGDNSLVVFAIDQETGALTLKQRISCGGRTPRQFTLDPTGHWLLCGNQDSALVTVFARNEGTGLLSGPIQTLEIDSPMMTLVV